MFNYLKQYKDLIFIFLISFILSLPYVIDICSGYLNYHKYDLQEFLLWNYTSINNIILGRDIFYPYGILSYFRNYNFVFSFIYYLVSPVIFTFVYFIFKKIFKDKIILYSSFLIFYLFILNLIGFQTFSRYGVFILLSLIMAYVVYAKKIISKKTLVYLGIILGLFFTLINDQGVYLAFSFLFSFVFNKFLYFNKQYLLSLKHFKIIFKEIVYLIMGGLIGILPVTLFFVINGNPIVYFQYYLDVKDIVLVAKTPFFSFINSPANIFTISIIYLAIFYIFLKLFLFRNKVSLSIFFQIILFFDILILEQKSIVRSIDTQITFISLMLLMFIGYDLVNLLKLKTINKRLIYLVFILVITISYSLIAMKNLTNFSQLTPSVNRLFSNKCFDYNFKYFLINNPSYSNITNLLRSQKNFNGKIYSFPNGDSALYMILQQKPPYYNAIFEGASYNKQRSIIKYIQDNEIQFITLNTNKSSTQDGVPDYIRQSYLFKYILNNYYPLALIDDHLILKKTVNKDFFKSKLLNNVPKYTDTLINTNIYKIPYSEGLYKYKNLKVNGSLLVETSTIDNVNIFLKKSKLSSRDKVIVISSNLNPKSWDLSTLKITTDNGFSTTIIFNTCGKNAKCVINLANIPLFYKNRIITKIKIDKGFKGNIEIFEINNKSNLW